MNAFAWHINCKNKSASHTGRQLQRELFDITGVMKLKLNFARCFAFFIFNDDMVKLVKRSSSIARHTRQYEGTFPRNISCVYFQVYEEREHMAIDSATLISIWP